MTQEDLNKAMLKNRYAAFFYGDKSAGKIEFTATMSLNKVRKEFGIHYARELLKRGVVTITNKQWLILEVKANK